MPAEITSGPMPSAGMLAMEYMGWAVEAAGGGAMAVGAGAMIVGK